MERIALANLAVARSPKESVAVVQRSIAEAGAAGARIVCFPECFLPGYRGSGYEPPPPDAESLEQAWEQLAREAKQAAVTVILGMYFATVNCAIGGSPTTSAVVNPDGTLLCWQPYGKEGLLLAEIDLDAATGLLAKRWKKDECSL